MSLFQIDVGLDANGGRRPSFLLTRELASQGIPVRLVVPSGSPLRDAAEAEGLPVLTIRMKGDGELGAAYRLTRVLRKHGCVLAHFHEAKAVSIGGAACARAEVPIRIVSRRSDSPLRPGLFRRRKHVHDADFVIAASDRVRDVLIHGGIVPGRIEVIPEGLDFSAFEKADDRTFLRRELGFPPGDFLAGVETDLGDGQAYRCLIEASRMLETKAPNLKLIVLGQGGLVLDPASKARNPGSGNMVFFLGFKAEAPSVFASLNCFVLSSEQEGQRASIMNAMACGLPVVATQVGGIPEAVLHDETGFLVSPRSPRALAEAVYAVYKNPELARRFGERGRQVVHERYSSLAMARRTIALYKRIAYRKMVKLGA